MYNGAQKNPCCGHLERSITNKCKTKMKTNNNILLKAFVESDKTPCFSIYGMGWVREWKAVCCLFNVD